MKKIILYLICLVLMAGCTSYRKNVRDQVERFGIEADSTKIIVKEGPPRFIFYNQFFTGNRYKYSDQWFTYVTWEEATSVPWAWNIYKTRYSFKGGALIRTEKREVRGIIDYFHGSY